MKKLRLKKQPKNTSFFYLLSFLIPFVASMGICFGTGVYPFGDRCILHIDMYHQYCPFFVEFLNKLQNGGSLMHTWKQGLGADFVALYAYYLASPLNWLLVLVPRSYVIEFMTVLIWLKIGIGGFAFFYYLKEHFYLTGKDNRFHTNTVWPAIICATAYALSGFVAAYSWNIMWMDCVALFPLIMVGLERLVQGKKVTLYFVTLAVCIWSNYYISIMICMVLAVYFVYLYLSQKKKNFVTILRFAGCSILAGGVSAVIILPELRILSYSGSSGIAFPEQLEWYFHVFEELARTCAVADAYTGTNHWPNLYAGVFSLPALVLFALNTRINWKKRLLGVLTVAFYYVSFANNYLDFIWHGFHFPNSLPGRQAFLYAFTILVLGFSAIRKWKGIRIWHIVVSFLLWGTILIVGLFVTDEAVTGKVAILVTLALLTIYTVGMVLLKKAKKAWKVFLKPFLVLLAIAEVITNMGIVGFYTTSRSLYTKKMDDYAALLEQADKLSDTSFYRVEDPQRMTKNDSALYGYASVTEFSSLMNINISHLYQSVYMEGGKNFYCYNGSIPLTSAMLGVKYTLFDSDLEENAFRKLVAQSGDYYLYENTYCLPLGYMVDENVVEQWDNSDRSRRIQNLNAFTRTLGVEEDMIERVFCVQEVQPGETAITISQPGYYYASYKNCTCDTLTETVSNGRTRKFSKTTHRYLLELGACDAQDIVTLSNSKDEEIEFYLYRVNENVIAQAFEILNAQTLQIETFTDTSVKGTVDVVNSGRLILSMPAERGWSLWVDGKQTEILPFKEALISVNLEPGNHEIELRYLTPGLVTGATISGCCLMLFVCWVILSIVCKKKKKESC